MMMVMIRMMVQIKYMYDDGDDADDDTSCIYFCGKMHDGHAQVNLASPQNKSCSGDGPLNLQADLAENGAGDVVMVWVGRVRVPLHRHPQFVRWSSLGLATWIVAVPRF